MRRVHWRALYCVERLNSKQEPRVGWLSCSIRIMRSTTYKCIPTLFWWGWKTVGAPSTAATIRRGAGYIICLVRWRVAVVAAEQRKGTSLSLSFPVPTPMGWRKLSLLDWKPCLVSRDAVTKINDRAWPLSWPHNTAASVEAVNAPGLFRDGAGTGIGIDALQVRPQPMRGLGLTPVN